MNDLEEKRRQLIAKRVAHKADSPLGHRYSNAVCQLESMAHLKRLHAKTTNEIADLEFEAIL